MSKSGKTSAANEIPDVPGPPIPPSNAPKKVRYRLGEPEVFAPVPSIYEWEYPWGKGGCIGCSAYVFQGSKWENEGTCYYETATDDDIDRVWSYYCAKSRMRLDLIAKDKDSPFRRVGPSPRTSAKGDVVTLFNDRIAMPVEGFGKDSPELRIFYVHHRFAKLVGVIHRPKDATKTEIRITYWPLREYASLLKDRVEADK